jgi:uncharacterized protein (DUF2141 family)
MQIMKHTIYYFLLALLSTNTIANSLTINISGIDLNQGDIRIGVFNNQEFPIGKPFKGVVVNSDKNEISKTLQVPSGDYAVAIFQDENNNQELDTNFLGMPTEKIGSSGENIFGRPTFDNAKITINSDKIISIKIK